MLRHLLASAATLALVATGSAQQPVAGAPASAPTPAQAPFTAAELLATPHGHQHQQPVHMLPHLPTAVPACCDEKPERKPLQSDLAFPRFVGPISNPILAKDPRSLTEARFLFINNEVPGANPIGVDDFQVYALQLRVALTERLTFIADKDGYLTLNPRVGEGQLDGWLNLAAGLKYTFIRDVENQFLAAAGFMYEIPSGEAEVFQGAGDGVFTPFLTVGKEFNENTHFLATAGYQFPIDETVNSSFYFVSAHLDRRVCKYFYPLVEVNWFHYSEGGAPGIPSAVGELDGLHNLGTFGVSGNDLVTAAVGLKFMKSRNFEIGAAWEFPISPREDFIDNRLTVEMILRY